ncbi:hypothetical protein TNCV_3325581 [Trichonephila clavipes]|nr:hypothetical protein TNCV_3325581 [Trichonephila clavipes]
MDKFLSRKRTFDDNKASTSAQTSIVPKIKSRKYSQEYLNFGFTITEVNGEEKPLCVICSKILAADSMKPNKLKRHFETLHESAQGYRTTVNDIFKRGKILRRTPIIYGSNDLAGVRTYAPLKVRLQRWGKTTHSFHKIPFPVNRANVKTAVVTLGTGDLPSVHWSVDDIDLSLLPLPSLSE